MHVPRPTRHILLPISLAIAAAASGDPMTRRLDIDFSRSVPSRNLSGLATRSDGRLVQGPALTVLEASLPELVWCLEPDGADGWLIGAGPDGRVIRAGLAGDKVTVADAADFEETNVFALRPTGPGEFLAGAAPGGVLYLVKDGAVTARAPLGAEVVWDIRHLAGDDYLVATGTPARIFKVSLTRFRKSGVAAATEPKAEVEDKALEARGITRWAEIRDRNVRRLIVAKDGRVFAGSSPRGAIYEFGPDGGTPFILNESKDAEVADLLLTTDGTLYAALVYGSPPAPERRIVLKSPLAPTVDPAAIGVDFPGRSEVLRFGSDRLPETVVSRNAVAFYKLAAFGDLLLIGAGERGEMLGYAPLKRTLLTFPGAPSSQVNGVAAIPGSPGRFLLLRNNFSGLAIMDFNGTKERTAETERLDLTQPARMGLLQFTALRNIHPEALAVDFKFGNSTDEGEGWSEWLPASREGDAYRFGDAAARYVRVRLRVPAGFARSAEIGQAALFNMPQNRPPAVQDLRVFPPGLGLIPAPGPVAPASLALGQFLFPNQPQPQGDASPQNPQKNSFLASQIVAQPGNQLVYWNVADPDGDNLLASLALRQADSGEWTDIASQVDSSYFEFNTAEMPEGPYVLKLTVTESAPRPAAERQTVVIESDDLVIDRSPPEILGITQESSAGAITLRVAARDKWYILRGARAVLNNGAEVETVFPEDGILDGPEEAFLLEIPRTVATGATSAEVMVVDGSGNRTSRRVPIAP